MERMLIRAERERERRGGAGVDCTGGFSSTGATLTVLVTVPGAGTVDPLSKPALLRAGDVAELFVCVPVVAFRPGQAKSPGLTLVA